MSDLLTYRFPGKASERKSGKFQELKASEVKSGFICTNFDLSVCYHFAEDSEAKTEADDIHFHQLKPYVMTPREYYLQAHELLNGLNLMQMQKAVFSRVKVINFPESKMQALFEVLCESYPNAFVYLISSEEFGTWIGATPEILLEAHQGFMFTTALAGTQKSPENGTGISWTEKEKDEQQIVVDYILETCKTNQLKAVESQGPYDFNAGPVTHIRTDISADLNEKKPWELARNLHPTPAISGYPKEQAISLIQSVEPHERGLYTGIIGSIDEQSAKLYVNLRCAQIQEKKLYLYLGGGYTPQSIPELEWIETENKSKTLINCVQKISNEN